MKLPKIRKNVIPRGEKGRRIKKRFEDESLCKKCGKCCYQGFVVCGYYVIMPELPCKHLVSDGAGHMICNVYDKRDGLEWCNNVCAATVRQGLFPPDCAYVRGVVNYHGKILPPKGEEERIRKALFRRVKKTSCPDYLKQEDWLRFLMRLSKPIKE